MRHMEINTIEGYFPLMNLCEISPLRNTEGRARSELDSGKYHYNEGFREL